VLTHSCASSAGKNSWRERIPLPYCFQEVWR
jgi:hypothetical protein